MKSLGFSSLLCFFLQFSFAQGEFEIHSNGLIYGEETMTQLGRIVDSLNLKFKTCDLSQTYRSVPQAKGHYFSLSKSVKKAEADLRQGISFEAFVAKYPAAEVDRNLLIVKSRYKTWSDEQVLEFSAIEPDESWGGVSLEIENQPGLLEKSWHGEWIFDTSDYGDGKTIHGFFIAEGFQTRDLPEKYARMVQYVDCMVDTNSYVLLEEAAEEGADDRQGNKIRAFLKTVNQFPGMPKVEDHYFDSLTYEPTPAYFEHLKNVEDWERRRNEWVENELSTKPSFKRLLDEAVQEALTQQFSDEQFEYYVERFYDAKTALQLKRTRRVVGFCSMDDSPRRHAVDIARLAAKSASWEVFLRSHLDVMNDRFDRNSDGSYAWARRGTYVRELEELGINVPDLMKGMSLRVENAADKHYFGSVGRLGRALSESAHREQFELDMLEMIADPALDDYNRVVFYYLFLNYNHYLEPEPQAANKSKLKKAVATMPTYLAGKMKVV